MVYCKLHLRTALSLIVILPVTGLSLAPASASEIAGKAVSVVQKATLSNSQGRQTMSSGTPVTMGDRIKTDRNGQVELVFTDDTKLVVGPNSSMVIESYLLRSDSRANNFTVRALGGSFRFITGKSDKNAYKIKTPTATIGVRGTSFDFSVRRVGVTNVVLFSGEAQVCNRSGCVSLERSCGLATAPRKDPARVIRDRNYRNQSIRDQFPYIQSQEQLTPAFHVSTIGCGDVTKATLKPPRTTGATRPGRGSYNDDDPEVSRPDPPSRDGPGEPGEPGEPGSPGGNSNL